MLADRGFNIEEDLNFYGAKLAIPAYSRGKEQLSLEEVEQSNVSLKYVFMLKV